MSKMRKLLAAVLVASMLLGSNGITYAAEAAGADDTVSAVEVVEEAAEKESNQAADAELPDEREEAAAPDVSSEKSGDEEAPAEEIAADTSEDEDASAEESADEASADESTDDASAEESVDDASADESTDDASEEESVDEASEDERIDVSIKSIDDVVEVSDRVEEFCRSRGISKRSSYMAALAMEEMAVNIVEHGFTKDSKEHTIDVRVTHKEGKVILRIKDDCIPFSPAEQQKLAEKEDITSNIGIRMVFRTASDIQYQNILGLNVLTIRI